MLIATALVFYAVAAGLILAGTDKYLNYSNVEEDSLESLTTESVNAYVGGDAYNFIINGTYTTAFFTLAVGFIVSGTLFIVAHIVLKKVQSQQLQDISKEQGGNEYATSQSNNR